MLATEAIDGTTECKDSDRSMDTSACGDYRMSIPSDEVPILKYLGQTLPSTLFSLEIGVGEDGRVKYVFRDKVRPL